MLSRLSYFVQIISTSFSVLFLTCFRPEVEGETKEYRKA